MAAVAAMAALPAEVNRRLAQVLREVDDTDLLWLQEIRELADQVFSSHYRDEPELIPKTPSQKKRQRRKRLSTLQDEQQGPGRKRLSRRRNSRLKLVPSRQHSQELHNKESLELLRAALKDASPPQRVTRSQAAASAKRSEAVPETPLVQQAGGKIAVVEIQVSDRTSAELHLQKSTAKPAELSSPVLLSSGDDSPAEGRAVKSPPAPAAPEPVVPQTPEANDAGESEAVSRQKTAKAAGAVVISSDEPGLEVADEAAQVEEAADKEPSQHARDSPGTPTGARLSRRSVRRSLMGKTSLTRRTSLAEKYSLASKRRSMTRRSAASTRVKKAARKSSVSSSPTDVSSSAEVPEDEETVVNAGPPPGPCTPPKPNPQSPQMSLRSQTANRNKEPQETSSNENNLHKNGVTQEPPQSARRKPSYKRAVDERYDIQHAQDGGLSPPRKKVPSPAFPASKVVRPFKTFLHTVQKNQLLMTPTSVGRHGVIKSFIKYNTPDPKEKERQKLETLRKKQEAEQLRKQKLEEEKKRRLEEAKLKREERLRKVLQTRERAEQIEEERKRRIEQKIALSEEKTEKVREERLAEEKIKKKAAAKKLEEAEARRRQEEEARRQRALQQEEEERRHRELVQKRKEEEQERARKAAEQRQAEQERERQLAAERELEKKKEQERIQAEKLREQQERAARLQKAVLAAEQQLHRETEKKQQEQQRLAEAKRQEQEQKKLLEEQKAKDLAQAQHPGNNETPPASESYQMTPQSRKAPKPLAVNTADNYGMDLNSDDSTDDESHPRKPIPAWATGSQLRQAVLQQYRHPPSLRALFGAIAVPRLESIFRKSKPRYFKRTSSAVWSSPPFPGARPALALPHGPRK
ncbi:inner centromere protein isoform X1 [Columba livia]|uniref:inner centromere protein isoform X1 n=1 Tax=Columba livia TaxID=8932 RepID=UPI0031BAFA38